MSITSPSVNVVKRKRQQIVTAQRRANERHHLPHCHTIGGVGSTFSVRGEEPALLLLLPAGARLGPLSSLGSSLLLARTAHLRKICAQKLALHCKSHATSLRPSLLSGLSARVPTVPAPRASQPQRRTADSSRWPFACVCAPLTLLLLRQWCGSVR